MRGRYARGRIILQEADVDGLFEYNPNDTIPEITQEKDPRRWLSAVIYPLKDADGRVREVVLVHEDINGDL